MSGTKKKTAAVTKSMPGKKDLPKSAGTSYLVAAEAK